MSRWFACCIKSAKAFLSIPTCYSQILFCLHFLRSRVYSTSDFGNAQEVFFSLRPNSKAILTLVINATFLTLKSGGTGFDCSVPTSTRGSRIQTGSKLNLSVIEREIKPRRPQASLSNMIIIRCRSTYYCIMDYCDEMAFVHNVTESESLELDFQRIFCVSVLNTCRQYVQSASSWQASRGVMEPKKISPPHLHGNSNNNNNNTQKRFAKAFC